MSNGEKDNQKEVLRPVFGRLVLKEVKAESETKSGIIIPDQAQRRLNQGVILDKGDNVEGPFEVGQKVAYGDYTGGRLELKNNDNVIIVQEDDVLGIIESEKEE